MAETVTHEEATLVLVVIGAVMNTITMVANIVVFVLVLRDR